MRSCDLGGVGPKHDHIGRAFASNEERHKADRAHGMLELRGQCPVGLRTAPLMDNSKMENPWINLPTSGRFVLPCDELVLNRATAAHLLLCDHLPVPFNGARDAAVVLLMLNPGGGSMDPSADYISQCRKRLTFESRVPFMSLDDAFAEMHGAIYWRQRLRMLIDRVGIDKVRRQVLCLQYFPYQSKTYKPLNERLPSQAFGFELCREAIRDRRLIVFMRSRKLWESVVPELKRVRTIELKNPRSPYLTPKNIPGDGFDRIVRTLEAAP